LPDSSCVLVVFCDSVSGISAADEAIQTVVQRVEQAPDLKKHQSGEPYRYLQALQQIVAASNEALFAKSRYQYAGGLRAALTVIAIIDQQAYIVNVGDNETYLIRNNQIRPLIAHADTQQTTYLGGQRQLSNLLRSGERDYIHSFTESLHVGDRVVICTQSLVQHLAAKVDSTPSEQSTRSRFDVQQAAVVAIGECAASLSPSEAAHKLTKDDSSMSVRALWRPLPFCDQTPSAAQHAEAQSDQQQPEHSIDDPDQSVLRSGGAMVLGCVDEITEREIARLKQFRWTMGLLALLIIVTIAGVLIVLRGRTISAAMGNTPTAISESSTAQPATVVTLPTDTPLIGLPTGTPVSNVTLTPIPERTLRPTRIPATAYPLPPTHTATNTAIPTSSPTIVPERIATMGMPVARPRPKTSTLTSTPLPTETATLTSILFPTSTFQLIETLIPANTPAPRQGS
jgi:serine/threonine protein phosphatase PrpC